MRIYKKKRLSCMVIGISAALSGIEHAIILPSAWGYLQSRFPGTHTAMLGCLFASYSLGALVAGPLCAWWSWICRNTRALLLTLNLFSLAGATFYFLGHSPWALVASRFVSGLGFGCQSILVVDLSRALTSEGTSRRALFLLHLSRQLGLLMGPALYLPLESAPYPDPSKPFYRIDQFSSPGILLAASFVLQELLFLFGYHNLTRLRDEERLQEQVAFNYHRFSSTDNPILSSGGSKGRMRRTSSLPHYIWSSIFSPTLDITRVASAHSSRVRRSNRLYSEDIVDGLHSVDNESDIAIESAEHFIMSASLSQSIRNSPQRNAVSNQLEGNLSMKSENHSMMQMTDRLISESSVCFEPISKFDRLRARLQEFSDEYLRDDTVVLLAIIFAAVTSQTILQTIIILFTREMYKDTERLNSFIFILLGFQLVLVALFAQLIRRLMVDRVLLLLDLLLLTSALLCMLLVMPRFRPNNLVHVPYMVVSVVTCFLASPLLVLCSSSLLINITAYDKQITTQELSQLLISLGSILGPLWAGAIWGHPYVLLAVPLGMVLVITILYILSFKHMISTSSSDDSYSGQCPAPRVVASGNSSEYKAILS